RIPHPEKSEHEIWYASLEGPEAGAYERGTAELENGRVFVPFSEHFQLVVNHQTMTVQLTPRYSDTYGLAVVKVTKKGFWVEELKNGGGSFAFDWNATAVRKGHEEYRVIRHASEMAAASDEEVEALANANNSVEEANDTDDLDTPTNEVQQQAVKSSFLKANRPNPFSRSTSIDYQLPAEVSNATLIVTDANGKAIQEHQLSSGTGTVEIDATNLPKGIYNYSLVLDGQIQETQRMILQ
ncbi:MAG: T9SS type A sorting domain-containing protein, partial [Saprospiraceae bacterium]